MVLENWMHEILSSKVLEITVPQTKIWKELENKILDGVRELAQWIGCLSCMSLIRIQFLVLLMVPSSLLGVITKGKVT